MQKCSLRDHDLYTDIYWEDVLMSSGLCHSTANKGSGMGGIAK